MDYGAFCQSSPLVASMNLAWAAGLVASSPSLCRVVWMQLGVVKQESAELALRPYMGDEVIR
ncbi:MAG: hypothetical protein HY683_08955 [Chloroflexi bacterium]|nr:hypothetical protein [Chloroflexota bacterium]